MVSFGRNRGVDELEAPQVSSSTAAPATPPQAAFPRVNLIPEQIALEAHVRSAKRIAGTCVALSALVVGGLYYVATSEASSAQDQLDAARARSATLAAEQAKYAEVPKLQAELRSAQAQEVLAMGGEVRWSSLLNNLSLSVPPGVALTNLRGTVTGLPVQAASPTTPGQSITSITGMPGVGTISFEGEALDQPHVATFLETILRGGSVIDPFATQVSGNSGGAGADTSGGTGTSKDKSVTFSATSTISPKALSHRYDAKGN
jgi:Tfp pilus assembly protein PilN